MFKTEVVEEKGFGSKEMGNVAQACRTIGSDVKRRVRRGTRKGSMDAKKRCAANSLETRDTRSKQSRRRGDNGKGSRERAVGIREGMANSTQRDGGERRGGGGGKENPAGREGGSERQSAKGRMEDTKEAREG